MARPKSKVELLEAAEHNYQALLTLINTMTDVQQNGTFPFEDRDRNIRDVLVHLHEWHNMMKQWYQVGMSGKKPIMPREGYSWKTTAELNHAIWLHYQDTDLQTAKALLAHSHNEMFCLIDRHSNEELFTKKYYQWTNTTSLGSYLVSATSSHYDWAVKKLKKYKKQLS
ncbi:ClbS/DfsB family four-helix bundle protein [Amphibacillus jilinensis]|uniref:ClbS/DfsB family four-helix bundle protein n=1 Tax=Amphibacillus jilinensis TaxID=1216008 RepID=UPI00030AD47A|nr:ClbS/DfsB family four-helix bundle protein [Amphibacillus jilinensis]